MRNLLLPILLFAFTQSLRANIDEEPEPSVKHVLQVQNRNLPKPISNGKGLWALVDVNGKLLTDYLYSFIGEWYDTDRICVKRNHYYGFLNIAGEEIIKPQYNEEKYVVGDFHNGIAIIQEIERNLSSNTNTFLLKDSFQGIDRQGNIVFNNSTGNYISIKDFCEGLSLVKLREGGIGCIDTKGQLLFKFYDVGYENDYFKGGRFVIRKGGSYKETYDGECKVIDNKGKTIEIFYGAKVRSFDEWGGFEANGGYGYYDRHGIKYKSSEELEKAEFNSVLEDANRGDVYCQDLVARCYYSGFNDGYHIAPQDYKTAFMWFEKAALQGHSRAQYFLGWMYQNGQGTVKDINKAKYWYSNSSYPEAQQQLLLLSNGNYQDVQEIKKTNLTTIYWLDNYTTSSNYHLRACIKSPNGITGYGVYLNGSKLSATRAPSRTENNGCDIVIDENLTLSEGINTIKVYATESSGGVKELQKQVTYKPNVQPPTPINREKRLALVIGNNNYNNSCFPNLRNAVNDARAISYKLKSLGFDVQPLVLNADKNTMWNAIQSFINKADRYDVALIYYSGHGLSPDGGANYLIPTDANIQYLDEVKRDGINSQTQLIAQLEKKNCKVKIALLDCCNNCNVPERGVKSAVFHGGLSKINPEGVFILHAASPGNKAIDGTSNNSPFVEAISAVNKNLPLPDRYPNLLWESFVKKIRESVITKTHERQKPYFEGVIDGDFYFNKK